MANSIIRHTHSTARFAELRDVVEKLVWNDHSTGYPNRLRYTQVIVVLMQTSNLFTNFKLHRVESTVVRDEDGFPRVIARHSRLWRLAFLPQGKERRNLVAGGPF